MIGSRSRALVVLCALLLVFPMLGALGSAPAVAQDDGVAPLAEAMPADVRAFVSTEFDLKNDQYVAVTRLATSLFIPGAGDTLALAVQQLAMFTGLIPADLQRALTGDIGIGLLDVEMASGTSGSGAALGSIRPDYAVVLHPEEAGAARQIVETWFRSQMATRGQEPERSQTGSIVVLTNPDPASVSFPNSPAVIVFSGDYILFGVDYDAMLPFVDATQGNLPTLADSAEMQQLTAALPSDRLLFGYLSGEGLTASLQNLAGDAQLVQSIDPPVGATAFTVAAADAGLRFESVSLPVWGTMLKSSIGTPTAAVLANPEFAAQVPDSTFVMFSGNDLGQSWLMEQLQKALLSQLMTSFVGGEVDLSNTDIGAQFGVLSMLTGIDFKADLMDQLQGEYGAALFTFDPADPLASSAVIASELGDVDRVSVATTSIAPLLQSAAAGTVSITTSSVADQTVNNIGVLNGDSVTTVQYGVVNDRLMVGLGDGLDVLATAPRASLADDAGYQAALAELPQDYSSILYVDLRSMARQMAPEIIQSLAAGSGNPLAQCLVANSTLATPVPAPAQMGTGAQALCSLIGLLFGENFLQDFLVSRVPGPFAAVTYQQGGLQHVSGILLVGSAS